MYMEYRDSRFKKGEDAQVKAGFQKWYRILRTLDDGGEWNLLILRGYESLAAIEANVEKADAGAATGRGHRPGADAGLPGPSKYRELVEEVPSREVILNRPAANTPSKFEECSRAEGRCRAVIGLTPRSSR